MYSFHFISAGSLVVRIVFLPFEESSYATFARLAGSFLYTWTLSWVLFYLKLLAWLNFALTLLIWAIISGEGSIYFFPTKHLFNINKNYWDTILLSYIFDLYLPIWHLSTGESPRNISNIEDSLLGALKLIMLIGTFLTLLCLHSSFNLFTSYLV